MVPGLLRPVVTAGSAVQQSPSCGGTPDIRPLLVLAVLVLATTVFTLRFWVGADSATGRERMTRAGLYVLAGWSWVAVIPSVAISAYATLEIMFLVGSVGPLSGVARWAAVLCAAVMVAAGSVLALESRTVAAHMDLLLGPGPTARRIGFFVLHALHTLWLPVLILIVVTAVVLYAEPGRCTPR